MRPAELAWASGDRPGELAYRHLPPPEVAAALSVCLAGFDPTLTHGRLAALAPVTSPVGRYRVEADGRTWFLRVSSRLGQPELELALTRHLSAQGVSINPIVSIMSLDWSGQPLRADLRPFLEARHGGDTPGDLRAAARALAGCHRALACFSGAEDVRRRAEGWNRNLDAAARALAAGPVAGLPPGWADRRREWLGAMLSRFVPDWHQRPGAQCLHGEVHVANVMYAADGRAILVDFEEAVHAFAPPSWDLAYLVQRFCLADDPGEETLRQRLAVVEEGYGALPPLGRAMREAAWACIAQIVHCALGGIATPEAECDKFVRLEGQGERLESLGL